MEKCFATAISSGSCSFQSLCACSRAANLTKPCPRFVYCQQNSTGEIGEMRAIIPGLSCPQPDPCWRSLPAERSAVFLPTYARISVALQLALREHVPVAYFQSLERFRPWKSASPMLVYQASRPFRGRVRTELTYDVLNPRLMAILFRRARANLIPLLERGEAELRAGGFEHAPQHYSLKRAPGIIESVQRLSASRRCLYRLVRSESALVDALVD